MRIILLAVMLAMTGCAKHTGESGGGRKADLARLLVKKYADEAYPMWAMRNPDKACPASLAELGAVLGRPDSNDPWGHPLTLRCGPTLPAGAHGIAVISAGPDGTPDTADDIKSWE